MPKESVTSKWESIQVTKSADRLNPLILEESVVAVDSKRLYIGASAQWTIKAKKLTEIKLEGDDTNPSSIMLTIATHEALFKLNGFVTEAAAAGPNWTKFFKRLQSFVNHSNVQLQMPSSNTKAVVVSRKCNKTANNNEKSGFLELTGKMRFSPNRKARSSAASPFPRRGTFGSKQQQRGPRLTISQPTVPWDEDNNNDDELIVQPSPVPKRKRRGAASKWDNNSDDEKAVIEDDESEKSIVQTDDDEEVLFDDAKKGSSKGNIFQDSDDDQSPVATRKSKKVVSTPITSLTGTPVGQRRRISPASRTQEKLTSSRITEDDKKVSSSPPNKGQQKLSSFFASAKQTTTPIASAVSSFDPSKRAIMAKTPERPSTTAKKSGDWLLRTRAGASPVKQRKKALFGTTDKFSAADDDDDPIQEFSPAAVVRTNPMDVLAQADSGPSHLQHDLFDRLPMTDVTRPGKRKRTFLDKNSLTPPRRLSMDSASWSKTTKPEENKLVPRNPWRGLRNLGNTCYLNSSIQMLVTLANTADGRTNWWESLRGKGGNITSSLLQIVDQLLVPPGPTSMVSVNPSPLKRAVDAITDKFIGYNQHDAHEFLSDLID